MDLINQYNNAGGGAAVAEQGSTDDPEAAEVAADGEGDSMVHDLG